MNGIIQILVSLYLKIIMSLQNNHKFNYVTDFNYFHTMCVTGDILSAFNRK